jgi:hypothetical protein
MMEKGNAETTIGAHFSDSQLAYESANGRKRSFDYFRNYLESTVCVLFLILRCTKLFILELVERMVI